MIYMEILDQYFTIHSPSSGEFKEKGSKFLGYAFPINTEEELDKYLEIVKTEHPKARHYCYAYKIGIDDNRFRTNDDGEPSGTAGKPIFGQILSYGISDVLIIVVRYFGGTKLGAAGLINAYKSAASETLTNSEIIQKVLTKKIKIKFIYAEMGHILNVIKQLNLEIIEKSFNNHPYIILEIRLSLYEATLIKLKARILKVSEEEAVLIEDTMDFEFIPISD